MDKEMLKNPQAMKSYASSAEGMKELRAEYSRMRDIAQKRLKRLGKSEFSESELYRANEEGFKKLSQIRNKTELSYEMARLNKFVEAKGSTIGGQREIRKRTIESLHAAGFTGINEGNLRAFGQFMEMYRKIYNDGKHPYNVDIYNEFMESGVANKKSQMAVTRAFNKWARNQGFSEEEIKGAAPKRKKGKKKK